MSMSANFHKPTFKVETLSTTDLSWPTLRIDDGKGNHVCVHLSDASLDQLEAAVIAYRADQRVPVAVAA